MQDMPEQEQNERHQNKSMNERQTDLSPDFPNKLHFAQLQDMMEAA